MCHNKFFYFSLSFFFSLFVAFSLSAVIGFAAEDYGTVQLEVKSDSILKGEINISITNIEYEADVYLIRASSKDGWKTESKLPEGKYHVNYITIGQSDGHYQMKYDDTLVFKAGTVTKIEVTVLDTSRLGEGGRRSLRQLIRDNTVNLILIVFGTAILIFLKRRRDRKYE